MFFQQLINGLSIGSIYALMAVGYSLIYSLLNFTNFAHSITVTIGAFCAFFFLSSLVQNLYLGIIIAVLAAGGLAMLIEILGYRPLLKKKAAPHLPSDHRPGNFHDVREPDHHQLQQPVQSLSGQLFQLKLH